MNYFFKYNTKIQNGEIITSDKVKRVYKRLVADILNGEKFVFDEKKSNHAIEFIENFCKHSKGQFADKPVILELWEKALISATFGIVDKDTRLRRFREVLLVIGKKNGKSLLASAISLYMLMADGENGAECYCAATKREQAKIVFGECERMVRKSPALTKYIKSRINCLSFPLTESFLKPLSADSNTEDGLNISYAGLDEIHAWQTLDLYNIIADGVSARLEPLLFLTTTAGFIRQGLYDNKYEYAEKVLNGIVQDDTFLPIIYELDLRQEWQDESCWIKANPNLGVSKSIEYLRRKIAKAKADSLELKNILTKEFNVRETSIQVWLNFEDAVNEATYNIKDKKPIYFIAGTDLSKTTDLTSACALWLVPNDEIIYVSSMYWLPYELLDKRSKEDKIPYDKWYEQGLLRVSNGNKVDYDDVVDWYKEFSQINNCTMYQHGYDSWSSTSFIKQMTYTFGDVHEAVIQGKKTLSNPMRMLGADLKSKKVNYNNNSITRWCLTNVKADVDKNDNIQPMKTSNTKQRIDGFAAMLNAYVRYTLEKTDYMNLINRRR